MVLHKGTIGMTYNIGGGDEVSNLAVARKLLALFDMSDREDEMITLVEDRPFNDLRYPLNSKKLRELGWEEKMSWEEGLKVTGACASYRVGARHCLLTCACGPCMSGPVEWYRKYSSNWDDVESALVAHPRRGMTADQIRARVRKRARTSSVSSATAAPAPAEGSA